MHPWVGKRWQVRVGGAGAELRRWFPQRSGQGSELARGHLLTQ